MTITYPHKHVKWRKESEFFLTMVCSLRLRFIENLHWITKGIDAKGTHWIKGKNQTLSSMLLILVQVLNCSWRILIRNCLFPSTSLPYWCDHMDESWPFFFSSMYVWFCILFLKSYWVSLLPILSFKVKCSRTCCFCSFLVNSYGNLESVHVPHEDAFKRIHTYIHMCNWLLRIFLNIQNL